VALYLHVGGEDLGAVHEEELTVDEDLTVGAVLEPTHGGETWNEKIVKIERILVYTERREPKNKNARECYLHREKGLKKHYCQIVSYP